MKKTYVKPELYFESFELSSNIAAGCSPTAIVNHAENTCPYVVENVFAVFQNETSGCKYTPDQVGNKVCYGVPTDDKRLFSS